MLWSPLNAADMDVHIIFKKILLSKDFLGGKKCKFFKEIIYDTKYIYCFLIVKTLERGDGGEWYSNISQLYDDDWRNTLMFLLALG